MGLEWQTQAACLDTDTSVFFPEYDTQAENRAAEVAAKAVCQRCPVIQACAAYAFETRQPYGIWAAMTEKERAAHRRRLQRRARRVA